MVQSNTTVSARIQAVLDEEETRLPPSAGNLLPRLRASSTLKPIFKSRA